MHVLGRGARHRRASPSDVTRLRKTNRRRARWRRAARRRARFARSRNGAPRRVPAPFPTRPFGFAAPNSTGRRVLAAPSAARARVKPLKVHRQVRQSPKGRFFSSARRPNKQTWHNPLAESRFSVSGSWKKSAPFGISDFWTRLSTFFFSKFSRWWEVGGSTVEKPNLGSDVARGRAGTRLAEKKNHD